MAQPIRFFADVERIEHHSTNVVSYQLKSKIRLPRFLPGQFVHLAISKFNPSGFWPESRVFSIANSVSDRRTLNLTISRQGEFTNKIIDQISKGSIVSLKGPYGEFIINSENKYNNVIMIAGGTGVTPFCSFMDFLIKEKVQPTKRIRLYYGARNSKLLIYKDLAEECKKLCKNFDVIYYLDDLSNSNQNYRIGNLNINEILKDCKNFNDTIFFLSGPKVMIDNFQYILQKQKDLSDDQVQIDAWE